MLYRLDAVDAYERKLVKQIEVASLEVEGGHNKGYVKLLSTSNKRGHLQRQGRTRRTAHHECEPGNGHRATRQRPPADHRACCLCRLPRAEPRLQSRREFLELSNLEKPLRPGEAIGDVDSDALKRLMIRRTIEEQFRQGTTSATAGHQGAESFLY